MGLLVVGLLLFLGSHSARIVAAGWRDRQIARLGEMAWKGLDSLVALVGLVLIIVGFSNAGEQEPLWQPPFFMAHVTALLVLFAFILVAAANVPRNHLKATLGHPMVLGVKLWAFGHLLANGQPRHLLLFGAFLVWAIVDYAASRRRDRAAGVTYPAGTLKGDLLAIIGGFAFWLVFVAYLHHLLIGVSPLG